MKFALTVLLLCALGCVQAQLKAAAPAPAAAPFAGMPSGQFFQNIVLQSEAQKLLVRPDLPVDLRQRVLDVMTNSEQGFNNCSTATATVPWMQMRCNSLQVKLSKYELEAIENEAKARTHAASLNALLQVSAQQGAVGTAGVA